MSMGGSNQIPETEEERALAEVAEHKFQYYKDHYAPMEDKFMERVDNMDKKGSYDFVRGAAGSSASRAFGDAKRGVRSQMEQQGLNPASGRYQGTMDAMTREQGGAASETMTRAGNQQQDEYVQGLANVTAIGRGQATNAQHGLSDVAYSASQDAASRAEDSFNRRHATGQLAGMAAGAGLQHINRE